MYSSLEVPLKTRLKKSHLSRHMCQKALDKVEHLKRTDMNRARYRKLQETIEKVFASIKEKHACVRSAISETVENLFLY